MTIPVSLFDPEAAIYVINITLRDGVFEWALNYFGNYNQFIELRPAK